MSYDMCVMQWLIADDKTNALMITEEVVLIVMRSKIKFYVMKTFI